MSHTFSYPQYSKSFSKYCAKCLKFLRENEYLTQQLCHQHYCPRCLCHLFQPHYLSSEPDIIIELYCGHYVDRTVIQQLFKEFCINCGAKYNPKEDVQMSDQVKLCRSCFDLQANRYKDFLLECMSCNRIIRTLSFIANTEVLLCRDCATKQSSLLQQKQRSAKEDKDIFYNPKKGHPVPQVPPPKMKKEESEPEEDISIVSRFSAFDISDSDTNLSKEHRNLKMTSKHSIEIRVQNLKIEIQKNQQQRDICSICGCMVEKGGFMEQEKAEKECRVCFMTNFDPRKAGSHRNLTRSSAEKNVHTSAPKNRGLERPTETGRTMKKSSVFGGTTSVATQPNPSLLDPFKSSISQAIQWKTSLNPWQNSLIDPEKLCEVCRQKKYMIIRSDQKKVCSGCYSKK